MRGKNTSDMTLRKLTIAATCIFIDCQILELISTLKQLIMNQQQLDHHANQQNPNNAAYQAAQNNRANQMNPNHSASKGKSGTGM